MGQAVKAVVSLHPLLAVGSTLSSEVATRRSASELFLGSVVMTTKPKLYYFGIQGVYVPDSTDALIRALEHLLMASVASVLPSLVKRLLFSAYASKNAGACA